MRYLALLTLIYAVLFSPANTHAQTKDLLLDSYNVFRVIQPHEYVTFRTRMKFAHAMLKYWEQFDSQVPALTQEEEEWIRKEWLSDDKQRLNRLLKSREWALQNIKIRSSKCSKIFFNLATVINRNSIEKEKFETDEWIKSIHCSEDWRGLRRELSNAKLISSNDDKERFYIKMFKSVQSIILKNVLPSAVDDLAKSGSQK